MELHRSVWGPRYWAFIHTAAMTATDVPTTKATLRSVVENVPCSECAPHARQYMQQHASEYAAITTAPQLAAFYVAFHNAVSARVGNEHGVWTAERAREFYSKPPPRFCGRSIAAAALAGLVLGVLAGRASRKCELRCALPDAGIEG